MRSERLRTVFRIGGIISGALLVILGAIWIYMGVDARSEVHSTISREQITGTPDMNPADTRAALEEAGLLDKVDIPDCDVAGKAITDGTKARCFAEYMRVHALEGSGGRTYSQIGRYLTPDGEETDNAEEAARNPETGRPVENAARNTWVSQRALATGLELAYVGEQISLFSIATGVVFVLVGIGFLVMLLVGGVLSGRQAAAAEAGPAP